MGKRKATGIISHSEYSHVMLRCSSGMHLIKVDIS